MFGFYGHDLTTSDLKFVQINHMPGSYLSLALDTKLQSIKLIPFGGVSSNIINTYLNKTKHKDKKQNIKQGSYGPCGSRMSVRYAASTKRI